MEIVVDASAIMAVGDRYKLLPLKNNSNIGRSPFEDIPYITADITTQEIVELLRESRAGI